MVQAITPKSKAAIFVFCLMVCANFISILSKNERTNKIAKYYEVRKLLTNG